MSKRSTVLAIGTVCGLTGITLLLSVRPSRAQGAGTIVVMRAVLATPSSPDAPSFDPGAPIPESDLPAEASIVAVLRRSNPKWSFLPLGTVTTTPQGGGAIDNGVFAGSAEIADATVQPSGTVSATLRLQALSRHPSLMGAGFSADPFITELPANRAHLIACLTDEGNPSEILVFASLISPQATAKSAAAGTKIARGTVRSTPRVRLAAVPGRSAGAAVRRSPQRIAKRSTP